MILKWTFDFKYFLFVIKLFFDIMESLKIKVFYEKDC